MALSKKKKKIITGLIIGMGAGLFVSSFTNFILEPFFDGLEKITYDYRYMLKYFMREKKEKVGTQKNLIEGITIVDIDERSFGKLGFFHKWPRSYHGDVVETLTNGGASAIVFDIMFKTADFGETNTSEVMEILNKADRKTDWSHIKPFIKNGLNHDSMMIAKISQSEVVMGSAFMNEESAYHNASDWKDLATEERHQIIGKNSTVDFPENINRTFNTMPILDNIFPEFARAVTRIGLINVIPDDDGRHRRIPLFFNFPDTQFSHTTVKHSYPIMALQTSMFLMGKTVKDIEYVNGEYANLGAPLRIYRKNGELKTSYPNFTVPMVEQIFRNRERILRLSAENPELVTISNPVIARKKKDGTLEAEILGGSYLNEAMIKALTKARFELSDLTELSEEKPFMLTETIGFQPGEDADRLLFFDRETQDDASIDMFTIEIFKKYWPSEKIAGLIPGKSLTVSGYLSLSYDDERDDYISPILILTKDVIGDLLTHSSEEIFALKEGEEITAGREIRIPVDDAGNMLINYQGMGGLDKTFRYFSYYDVLKNRTDPTNYQGRAFLLGSSAAGLFDIVASTFDQEYPGVEIHATLIHNILTNSFMKKLKKWQTHIKLIIIGLLSGLCVYFLPLIWSLLSVAVLGIVYGAVAFFAFENSLWLELARPEITIAFTFLLVISARYLFEERDKRFLNDAFKNYISPELIDMMVESGSKPSLGGSEAVLTAYFTDIQSFSTFSEKLGSPTKLVELLNEYLSAMTDILLQKRGTLDKYEGDAIIAFFGAPVRMDDHAEAACLAGLAMQKCLKELRKKWKSEGDKWPDIVHNMRMRIGINSGPIVTGNMGSKIRMNYTMMGDTVNLAARLESGAKQYGVYTIASEESLKLSGHKIFSRELDRIQVVGKSEPVTIHELMCLKEEVTPEMEKCAELFAQGLALYRKQKWDEARKIFSQCEKYEPNLPEKEPGCKTTPSRVFMDRCAQFKVDRRIHFPPHWDGVYAATEK